LSNWQDIRIRAKAHGESIKSIARSTGHSRNTIRKYLRSDHQPAATSQHRTSILQPYLPDMHSLLEQTPKMTTKRLVAVLRERNDQPLRIGERAARKFVAKNRRKQIPKEAFIRLVYAPGSQMQIDFKDIEVALAGHPVKHHMLTARLSHSGAFFAKVYRSEDRPSLLDGIISACVAFGGVAKECVFDNAKTAVKHILRGRKRDIATEYQSVCGSLGLSMEFAAPAKGNEKGGVEGTHGYLEDNYFRPMRNGDDLVALNNDLRAFCAEEIRQRHPKFSSDQAALNELPMVLPQSARHQHVHINKFAEVTYSTVRYSVPTEYAHRKGEIHISHDKIRVFVDNDQIAEHERCFERYGAVLNPLHYLQLLSFKHRAVERAEIFARPNFPAALSSLLRLYVDKNRDSAGKKFMRVMELLMVTTLENVIGAVEAAQRCGTIDPAAIELISQQREQVRYIPAPLLMKSHEPKVMPITVDLKNYAVSALQEYAS
jgi:transposase